MKVGLSFSRCVRDIVDGVVDINDVLVIIARTDFDPRNPGQWYNVWQGYGGGAGTPRNSWSRAEWSQYTDEDESRVRDVSIELWESGRLHQPRQFGAHPARRPEIWLETVLISSDLDNNPAAKKAWNNFQTVAGLTNIKLDKDYQ